MPLMKRQARGAIGLWGLLQAAAFAATLISLAGFLGALNWRLDILSHFRIQYALVFLLLALVFALGRRWKPFAGSLAMALVNGLPVLFFLLPPAPPGPQDIPSIRAMLANVNCGTGNPAAVRTAVSNAAPDILVLEEISPRWLEELAPVLAAYPHHKTAPRFDNFGIGLFSRFPIESARIEPFGLIGSPSIFARLVIQDRPCAVVATHPMPPGDARLAAERNRQLDWIAEKVAARPGPVLLLGDLNTSPWSPVYRRLIRRTGLLDSARGRSVRPTWPAPLPLLWLPLDHIFHSPDIVVHSRAVGPDIGSDHFPVIVDFSLCPPL